MTRYNLTDDLNRRQLALSILLAATKQSKPSKARKIRKTNKGN